MLESGSIRRLADFKERIGARIVGEESAGSAEGPTAGHIFLLTLPNSGLKVRIPNAWNRTNIAHFDTARGVPVDELVTPTVADVQAGKDAALDVAKAGPILPAPSLATALGGSWTGQLEYRDFGNDKRVVLPLEATVTGTDRGVDMHFTFDDGPGKTVRSTEQWTLAADGTTLSTGQGKDREMLSVVEHRGGSEHDITSVADGRRTENDHPVLVRTVIARRGDALSITRQTRRPHEPFLMRHAYELETTHPDASVPR